MDLRISGYSQMHRYNTQLGFWSDSPFVGSIPGIQLGDLGSIPGCDTTALVV